MKLILAALLALSAFGQVSVGILDQIGTGAPPSQCTSGQRYFRTSGVTAGQNLLGCTSTDVWTTLGDGGGTSAFSSLTPGTNTNGAMVIGSGSSLTISGTGTNTATALSAQYIDWNASSGPTSIANKPANSLPLAGGTMTGQIVTASSGIEFTESDSNPGCSTGNFTIFADLSENKLKKCQNGTASDLDTSGGSPDFSTIGTGTNTTATLTLGAGGVLTFTSTGQVNASHVNGVSYPASPPGLSVPVVASGGGSVTYKQIPDCDDASGQHLNFDQTTAAFSCGTSGSGGVPTSRTLTGGAGIAAIGDLSVDRTIATASGEADFLASGALTCGAGTQGSAKVHTTAFQYCDNSGTPTLRYAAYGTSAGSATSVGGITVSGTPSTGQVLTATSSSAANWQASSGGTVITLCVANSANTTTYTCTGSPAPSSYTSDMIVQFRMDVVNTGSATLNINGLGAKTIYKITDAGLTALVAGDISAGDFWLTYNAGGGGRWEMIKGNVYPVQGGFTGEFAYYPADGYKVAGNPRLKISGGDLTVGVAGTTSGTLSLANSTSGAIKIQNLSSGNYNFNLPASLTGASGKPLLGSTSGSTSMTWGSITGNTGTFATATGTISGSKCAEWDANGNLIAAASACGGTSGGDVTDVGDCAGPACFSSGGSGTALVFRNGVSGTITLNTVGGALGTVTLSLPAATGTIAYTVKSGSVTLGTSAIASGACATAVTDSASGVTTSDVITFTPNADISGVTGFAPTSGGGLEIKAWPTSNQVNFKVCNWSGDNTTPGSAVTLNYRVSR